MKKIMIGIMSLVSVSAMAAGKTKYLEYSKFDSESYKAGYSNLIVHNCKAIQTNGMMVEKFVLANNPNQALALFLTQFEIDQSGRIFLTGTTKAKSVEFTAGVYCDNDAGIETQRTK